MCGSVDTCADGMENDADNGVICDNIDATTAVTTEVQTQIQADKDNDLDSDNMCGSVDTCADDMENDADDNGVICDNIDDSENSDPYFSSSCPHLSPLRTGPTWSGTHTIFEEEKEVGCRRFFLKMFPWCRRWMPPLGLRVVAVRIHSSTHTT